MWKKLKNLFSKPKPDLLRPYRSPVSTLTLERWQGSDQLTAEMARIASEPIWRAFVQMMRNESPSELKLPQLGTPRDDRAALQAQIEGYMMAMNNLEAASRFNEPIMDLPQATFPDEQEPR